MTCEQTAESLPWLLNGTLAPDESRRVRDHLGSCADCREALRRTRTVWALHEGHLPTETIVDYSLGTLEDPELRGLAERHLETCARCSAELDLVRGNPQEAAVSAEDPSRFAMERRAPTPIDPGGSTTWRNIALAAGLAALLVGGGWLQSARQQRELKARIAKLEVPAPQINPAVIELLPDESGVVLRGEAVSERQPNKVKIPAEAMNVNLVLLAGGDACSADCAVEILSLQDQPVWSAGGFKTNEAGHLTLGLPKALLPAGTYKIQAFDRSTPDRVVRYIVQTDSE